MGSVVCGFTAQFLDARYGSSNIMDINSYTNLCIKITHDNIRNNCGNIRENYGNIRDKSCQLKLNNMNYNVNYHVEFGAQISIPSIIDMKNYSNIKKDKANTLEYQITCKSSISNDLQCDMIHILHVILGL